MTEQQERKQAIRKFMRDHYDDQHLAMLLAHARDGKLAYFCCCCFIGIPTADHALQTQGVGDHIAAARRLVGALEAELGYAHLYRVSDSYGGWLREYPDRVRCRILIPMIRCEMERRSHLDAILLSREQEKIFA